MTEIERLETRVKELQDQGRTDITVCLEMDFRTLDPAVGEIYAEEMNKLIDRVL